MTMSKLANFLATVWNVSRYPRDIKTARTMTIAWAIAFILPGISVGLSPQHGLDMTRWWGWSNLICAFLSGFMLYTSIRGLFWFRAMEKSRLLP